MSKHKRGPALFELLDESRSLRKGQHPFRVIHDDKEPEHDQSEQAVRIVADDEPEPQPGARAGVQLHGDRLHVWLTPVTAAIALFLLSITALGIYFLGQTRGQKAAQADSPAGTADQIESIESVRQQPPATHLVESLFENNPRPAPARDTGRPATKTTAPASASAAVAQPDLPPGPRAGWARDYTYIVAQEFGPGREKDAQKAREFLSARGFAADLVRLESGAFQLITLEGYNHKDPAQKKKADEILKKQRAAGAEYFASGGGYKLEGYFKTLKKDQW